jgi:hypothetical protein
MRDHLFEQEGQLLAIIWYLQDCQGKDGTQSISQLTKKPYLGTKRIWLSQLSDKSIKMVQGGTEVDR